MILAHNCVRVNHLLLHCTTRVLCNLLLALFGDWFMPARVKDSLLSWKGHPLVMPAMVNDSLLGGEGLVLQRRSKEFGRRDRWAFEGHGTVLCLG